MGWKIILGDFFIFFIGFVVGAAKERVLSDSRNNAQGFLTCKSAERFLAQMKENENKKASPEELERIKANYETMKKIIDKSNL